ncbi:AraC family transcriptional regulator [Ruegeria lacuscaerulensis]|uniref:AraC family transcriptional regulator n=1 Tax=Ruegeria lacuscaerulensis TaxID=55218 RepID=UPI00147AED0C|nr:AraC family transcriptional regulator [Ruegeria lacuscaerulensis]
MKTEIPGHGAIWAARLFEDLKAEGFRENEILRDTGLNRQSFLGEDRVLAFDKIARLFENAAELKSDDLIGFKRGQCREAKRAGLLAYVGLSSPTVADYIKNIARFRRVFSFAAEIDVTELDAEGKMYWRYSVPETVNRRQYNEFGAAATIKDLRRMTNRDITPLRLEFRHPRNANTRDLERFFGCPIKFAARNNMVQFKPAHLSLPLHTSDDHLLKVLIRHCEIVLASHKSTKPNLVTQVEREIVDRLASSNAQQDAIAAALGLSSRTLSRRLADMGTSFHEIMDELRKSLALRYLKDSDIPQSEIAYLLGYANLSSFSTAFKRWTGEPPSSLRKEVRVSS